MKTTTKKAENQLALSEKRIWAKRQRMVKRLQEVNPDKRRMRFSAFVSKYGRVILGGLIVAIVVFCSVCAPLLTQWDPEAINVPAAKLRPGQEGHLFGTDMLGRDIWARILFGSRNTLIVSIGAQLITTLAGTALGLLCGYYTKIEKYLMRFLDAFATIPNLLLCLLMVSVFGSGVPNLMLAMSVHGIPGLARMVRNQVLSLREKEYIESEKAMGASDLRTMILHILPACFSYLLVRFSTGLGGAIMSMTSLSYLGVGLDPTVASWGGMIQESQKIMFAVPHTFMVPMVAIAITVFGFSMLGDGLRDRLDPRLK